MNQPLVSVVIPNYCHARYLKERIESVLAQTYQHFELIILDDCSPDDGTSRQVIEQYRDNPHVTHIVYNQQNSGSTFRQWNKGFGLAKGELIWIAESDDSCEPDLLENLVKRLVTHTDASVAFCRSVAFNENGFNEPIGIQCDEDVVFDGRDFIHDKMRSGTGILNASCALIRTDSLHQIAGHYINYKGSGDRMFWVEMAEQGRIVYSSDGLNKFRTHQTNSTKKFTETGVNQREDKVILDYIYSRDYISKEEYRMCRSVYIRVHIFEMLTDKQLKRELYQVWGAGLWEQAKLRLDAWKRKLIPGKV